MQYLQLPERNRLREIVEDAPIPCLPGPERDAALLGAAREAAEGLPPEFHDVLADLADPARATHAVLIGNLPVDRVVTGLDRRCRKPGHRSDVSLLAVVLTCGVEPFQYRQESDSGQLLKAVTPVPDRAAVPFNGGRVPLGMHTDNPFLGPDFWPELMTLVCSANAPGTPTMLAPLPEIDLETLRRLFCPDFRHRAPNSFDLGGAQLLSDWVPVIRERNGRREIGAGLYDGITKGRNAESREALASLAAAAARIATEVVLRPGQALVWDNQTVIHGRAAIEDRGPRYLQRVYSRRNLDALRRTATDASTNVFDCLDIVPHAEAARV